MTATDDMAGFWRSKVKFIAGRQGAECIHVNIEASKFVFWFQINAYF